MTVKLKRKSDGVQVEAMFFDGTQTGAVGISAWAGSEGATVNMSYRGGDNSDYILSFPEVPEDSPVRYALAGDWVARKENGAFAPLMGSNVSEFYEAVTS